MPMGIKNRINKRAKAFFFALIALLTLSGCGVGDDGEENGNDTELFFSSLEIIPSDSSETPTGNNIAFPSEFTVLCESGKEKDFFAAVDDTDIFSKTVFERNAQLFEMYGITLNEVIENDIASRAVNDMLSEDKGYDMLLISAPSAASLISAGALADLESIAGWTPTLTGYSEQVISDLSIGGRSFLAAGDATPSTLRSASAVLVNTSLAEKISDGGNIITAAKNGHFTYESMLNYSRSFAEISVSGGSADPSSAIRAGSEDAINLYLSGGGRFFVTDTVTDVPSAADFWGNNLSVYSNVMSVFGIYEGEDMSEEESEASAAITPLFTVASIGELEALTTENAPFAALPMPKSSVIQDEYYCNIDISKAAFTALPLGSGETEAAVMNLIYSLSGSITDNILSVCDPEGSGNARLVYESMCAEALTLFGFGDLQAFMGSCVNERTTAKVFAMRAAERSTAASAALSIITEKLTSGNKQTGN